MRRVAFAAALVPAYALAYVLAFGGSGSGDRQPATPARLNLAHSTSFVVYPADCNHLGSLFGGKLLAEMDRTAGVTVRRLLYASRVKDAVTVAADGVRFHKAGAVKDLVVVTGEVKALGRKSVTVAVKAERETAAGRETLADGTFTFAAYDAGTQKAAEHGLSLTGGEK